MECLPAIDIRAGRCVRLLRGDFDAETVYGDPVEQAVEYAAAGAGALHVVDLDAARTGEPINRPIVEKMRAASGLTIQLGGGIRNEELASAALESGIEKVVVGTFAVEAPARVAALAARYPGRIVVGLDHRAVEGDGGPRREVAVRGWVDGGGVELLAALDRFADSPLGGVVVTDISRDGTLAGPDLDGYAELLHSSALPIIASGGIGATSDLAALAALRVADRRLAAVVVGRALLDGAMTLAEAVRACAP